MVRLVSFRRGWRLLGLAGTIFVYVAGILLLSIISLQNSNQRRPRSFKDRDLLNLHRREMLIASVHTTLNWCRPLTFTDGKPMNNQSLAAPIKPMQTFPGHFVGLKSTVVAGAHDNHRQSEVVEAVAAGNGSRIEGGAEKVGLQTEKSDPIGNQIHYEPKFYSRTRRKLEEERMAKKRSSTQEETNDKNIAEPSSRPQIKNQQRNEEAIRGLTALVSFPGSGNTWLRYLLQQCTGFFTGSVYKDLGLMKSGFPAENIHNSSVLVVKTHEWGPGAFKMFDKAILLVRDPKRAIVAEFNRQSGGHVGFASRERFTRTQGKYWHQFVVNKLYLWENTNLSWAKQFPRRLKIVFYDDLVANVETTLRDILQFINHKVDEELFACALSRKEGIYKRRKRLIRFDPFTKEMHTRIEEKTKEVYSKLGRN